MPSNLFVANDVLCKFFVINGGTFCGKVGNVFYCVPDKRQMGRYVAWLLAVFTEFFAAIYLNFASFITRMADDICDTTYTLVRHQRESKTKKYEKR